LVGVGLVEEQREHEDSRNLRPEDHVQERLPSLLGRGGVEAAQRDGGAGEEQQPDPEGAVLAFVGVGLEDPDGDEHEQEPGHEREHHHRWSPPTGVGPGSLTDRCCLPVGMAASPTSGGIVPGKGALATR